jgi:beta-1,2-mannosidase
MYFGAGCIYYAFSQDLLRWGPCPEDDPVLSPGPGTFMGDSQAPEAG